MPDYAPLLENMVIRKPDKYALEGGIWHAKRSTDGRPRFHEGIDILTEGGLKPMTYVLAHAPCVFERMADPYPDKKDSVLRGMVLRDLVEGWKVKLLYMRPIMNTQVGRRFDTGEVIGWTQTLQHLYKDITDHIHVELYTPAGERVDPTPHFFRPAKQAGVQIA